jgi:glycosyltransferase involved in cell wall biosynthesis
MRILFITTGLGRGGAEMQLVLLALRQKSCGHDVTIVSMLPPRAFEEELGAAEIPVVCLRMRRGLPNPLACVGLARIIKRVQPDVIHSHMVHANLLARITRIICRMPVLICTAQNVYEIATREKVVKDYSIRDFLYRITDSLADVTTQICNAGATRYLRVKATSSQRMRVIYNAVDVKRFTPDSRLRLEKRRQMNLNGEWVWLAVGRFEEAKDYSNLLRAFSEVRRSRPTDRLLIAGEGPLRGEIEAEIRGLALDCSVNLLGLRKDVAEIMQAADAFVMSSKFEGLPLVLIEAHASGLPIVATHVGGNSEVVLDGESGFLCQQCNPAALAKAMLQLRVQPETTLSTMRTRGREHICRNFALDKIFAQWEALYRELRLSTGGAAN